LPEVENVFLELIFHHKVQHIQ